MQFYRLMLFYILSIVAIPLTGFAKGDDSYSLTIYSKASPGSINPDSYRPLPGAIMAIIPALISLAMRLSARRAPYLLMPNNPKLHSLTLPPILTRQP